jgi:hypothetical protein
VKSKVESIANTQLSSLENEDKVLAQSADNLRTEIVTELAPLSNSPNLQHEKDLLKHVEALEWGDKEKNEYINSVVSSSPHITRDSSAIMAGQRIPAHIYYEGVAVGVRKHCEVTTEFWKTTKRLLKQLQTQVGEGGITEKGKKMNPVNTVMELLKRFHLVARQLNERYKQRPTLKIDDEYDVQDLLHVLLRLHFDDIRPEEWTPSYGGGASRMDFLLKKEQVVVEAKMTRPGLGAKQVSEQLIIDAAKYKEHPNCRTLVCFVYDPSGLVKNPRGVEDDLARLSKEDLEVLCIIIP